MKHLLLSILHSCLILSALPDQLCASHLELDYSDTQVCKHYSLADAEQLEIEINSNRRSSDINAVAYLLPSEIWTYVFSHLSWLDIVQCSQVSQTWYQSYQMLLSIAYKPLFCQQILTKELLKDQPSQLSPHEAALAHLIVRYADDSDKIALTSASIDHDHNIYSSRYLNNISKKIDQHVNLSDKLPFYLDDVEQSYDQVSQWYAQTKVIHDVVTQYNLGFMYRYGYGVKQNYALAHQWYEKAAQQNFAKAQVALGQLYYKGYGVEQDLDTARQWFEKAALQNHAKAQYRFGLVYHGSDNLEQDLEIAHLWFEKAAWQNYIKAQLTLSDMYYKRRNYQKAYDWCKKAAVQGHAKAQFNLGLMYSEERGVERNGRKAQQWYRKAALQGCVEAQYNLGLMYSEGQLIEQNYKRAYHWCKKAALQNHVDAQVRLGCMFYDGIGVKQNFHQAQQWFEKAAIQDEVCAQYNLSQMYFIGNIETTYHQVHQWYTKSFEYRKQLNEQLSLTKYWTISIRSHFEKFLLKLLARLEVTYQWSRTMLREFMLSFIYET